MPVMSEEEREKSQRIAEARLEKAMRKSIDAGRDAYGHLRKSSIKKDRSRKGDTIELVNKGNSVELSAAESQMV